MVCVCIFLYDGSNRNGEAGGRTSVRKYLQLYTQKCGLAKPVYFHYFIHVHYSKPNRSIICKCPIMFFSCTRRILVLSRFRPIFFIFFIYSSIFRCVVG